METDQNQTPNAHPIRDSNKPAPQPELQTPGGVLIPKASCIAAMCVPLAYMTWLALSTLYRVPALQKLLLDMDLEGPLPLLTQVLMKTYAFWWLLPLALALVIVDIARRKRPDGLYVGAVFACACLLCWVMQAVAIEGSVAPLFHMMQRLAEPH